MLIQNCLFLNYSALSWGNIMKCLNRFHTTTKCEVLNGPKLFKSEWARHISSAHKGKKVGLSPPGPTASPAYAPLYCCSSWGHQLTIHYKNAFTISIHVSLYPKYTNVIVLSYWLHLLLQLKNQTTAEARCLVSRQWMYNFKFELKICTA